MTNLGMMKSVALFFEILILEIIIKCAERDDIEVVFDLSHRELKFELKRTNLKNPELVYYKLSQALGRLSFPYQYRLTLEKIDS